MSVNFTLKTNSSQHKVWQLGLNFTYRTPQVGAGPVLETLGIEGIIRTVPDGPLLRILRSPDIPVQEIPRGGLLPPPLRFPVGVAGVEQASRVAGLVKTLDHLAQCLLVSRHCDLPSDLPTELDSFLKINPGVESSEEAGELPRTADEADVVLPTRSLYIWVHSAYYRVTVLCVFIYIVRHGFGTPK